jgi:hypothetical protein
MKKQMFLLIMGLMLLVAPAAMAYKPGDLELALGGGGSNDESFDNTVFNIQAGLGCFVTPNLEGIYRQEISYSDSPGNHNLNGSTRLSFDYHFNLRPWYPYLGGNIGYVYGDTVEEQFIAGPEVGVKYFVNDTTFIAGGLEYQVLFKKIGNADNNFDSGRFVYILGIGFKF